MTGAKLDDTERILREVRSILNKLTPQNFNKLVKDLAQLGVNRDEYCLRGTIDIIFEKVMFNP